MDAQVGSEVAASPTPAPAPVEPKFEPIVLNFDQPKQAEAKTEEPIVTENLKETPQEAQPQQERDAQGRFKNPVQPRIDELVRQRGEQEREAAFWRARAAELEGKATPAVEEPKPPKKDDFESYDAYVEALTEYKADVKTTQALNKFRVEQQETAKAQQEQEQAAKVQTTWQTRLQETTARISDFREVMDSVADRPIAKHVIEIVKESDVGPDIAYHLAKNEDLALRLNSMSPIAAAREIGRLEATLGKTTSAAPSPAPTPATRQSSAPPPLKPVQSATSTNRDPALMGHDEYRAYRRQQGARW